MKTHEKEYWLYLADESLETAKILLREGRYLHCGFFCHLAVESALKGAIAEKSQITPPKVHALHFLAKKAGIWNEFTKNEVSIASNLQSFQIMGRYPKNPKEDNYRLRHSRINFLLTETEDLLCSIKQKLLI